MKIIERNNKFYRRLAVNHAAAKGLGIGTVMSGNPAGPFTEWCGSALITLDMLSSDNNDKADLDPNIFIDDDGTGYIFWSNNYVTMQG